MWLHTNNGIKGFDHVQWMSQHHQHAYLYWAQDLIFLRGEFKPEIQILKNTSLSPINVQAWQNTRPTERWTNLTLMPEIILSTHLRSMICICASVRHDVGKLLMWWECHYLSLFILQRHQHHTVINILCYHVTEGRISTSTHKETGEVKIMVTNTLGSEWRVNVLTESVFIAELDQRRFAWNRSVVCAFYVVWAPRLHFKKCDF